MPEGCSFTRSSGRTSRLRLDRFTYLNPEGQRLVRGWFERAYAARGSEDDCFEAFIFVWFAVNGWAACVTGKDRDFDYIAELQRSVELAEMFTSLLEKDAEFRETATRFHAFWPIFKAQSIRRAGQHAPLVGDRASVIQHYLSAGIRDYQPTCWQFHRDAGEAVPLDWPHTLAVIYRVRCNLFHGEKSVHSEMDRVIVLAAYRTLIGFFRGAALL